MIYSQYANHAIVKKIIKSVKNMSKILEKKVIFRCEEHLYNAMVEYARSHRYKNVSQLIRAILVHHFMEMELKEAPDYTRNQMKKLIEKNIKRL
jgi:hypothetical protein